MGNLNIQNLDTTNMGGQTHSISSSPITKTLNHYDISPATLEIYSNNQENIYDQTHFAKYLGFYKSIPELQAVINKKALWTIGKGFKASGSVKSQLESIKGNGKDTFDTITNNSIITYTIGGDSFSQIVKDADKLINLKPINPYTIRIVTDRYSMIKRYEQWFNGKLVNKFEPEEIFHLAWNKILDESHGNSTIEKLEKIIKMKNQAQEDMAVVFHCYVKPLVISEVDSDNATEVASYKSKLDSAFNNMENLIIPKGTATLQLMSVPEYSSMNPIPWIELLNKYFVMAEGIPLVILGTGEQATEAIAKIQYLAFQQVIEFNQLFLEQQIKSQLGIDIEYEFPASLEQQLNQDNKKDGNNPNKPSDTKPTTA